MIALGPYGALIKLGSAVLLAVGLIGFGWWLGGRAGAVEVAELKTDHAEVLRDIADEARDVANAVRMREQVVAQDIAAIATAYEDKRNEAVKKARDSVLADVRAGRIRLRAFTGQASAPANATSPAACQCDGQAASGGEDTGTLAGRVAETIAIAAEADAQLSACQATVTTYYNATKGPK